MTVLCNTLHRYCKLYNSFSVFSLDFSSNWSKKAPEVTSVYLFVSTPPGTTENRRCWSGSDRQTDVPRFHSEERSLALRLCGWINRGPDINVEPFLRSLEGEGEWERAAAVALFNLDIRRAIQILNKGASAERGTGMESSGTGLCNDFLKILCKGSRTCLQYTLYVLYTA